MSHKGFNIIIRTSFEEIQEDERFNVAFDNDTGNDTGNVTNSI